MRRTFVEYGAGRARYSIPVTGDPVEAYWMGSASQLKRELRAIGRCACLQSGQALPENGW